MTNYTPFFLLCYFLEKINDISLLFSAAYFLPLLQVHWSAGEATNISVFSLATYSWGRKDGILSNELGSASWYMQIKCAASSALYFWQQFSKNKLYFPANSVRQNLLMTSDFIFNVWHAVLSTFWWLVALLISLNHILKISKTSYFALQCVN